MRALYDSQAHAMYIDVVEPPADAVAGADSDAYPVLVHFDHGDRIVGVEILYADAGADQDLIAALRRHDLPVEAILSARDVALRNPDCPVVVEVGQRLAA